MSIRHAARTLVALMLATFCAGLPLVTSAQNSSSPHAFIVAGSCEGFDHSKPSHPIGEFQQSTNPEDWTSFGMPGTPPEKFFLATARAEVKLSDLVASPHALIVTVDDKATSMVVSCHSIGPLDGNGTLLMPMTFQIPGVQGAAAFSPDGSATDIRFGLWLDEPAAATQAQQPATAAQQKPAATPIPVDISGIPQQMPPVTQGQNGTPAAVSGPYQGMVIGKPDAPVTLVVYMDFQCPYCGLYHKEIVPQILRDFVIPGKVKIEFREYPFLGGQDLSNDKNESAQSAEAVMCAAEHGKYLEYSDALFANQNGENQGAFADANLVAFAKGVGIDEAAFTTCLDADRYTAAITQSRDEGAKAGVTGTPMMFINNQLTHLTNAGYDMLKEQLQAAVDAAG